MPVFAVGGEHGPMTLVSHEDMMWVFPIGMIACEINVFKVLAKNGSKIESRRRRTVLLCQMLA